MKASQINVYNIEEIKGERWYEGKWERECVERWKIYYKINDGSMDVKITKTSIG